MTRAGAVILVASNIILAAPIVSVARAVGTLQDREAHAFDIPHPAIVLFSAAWCAPCRVELTRLQDLTAEASPIPVIVIPIDSGSASIEALRGVPTVQIAYLRNPVALMALLAPDAAGLPVAVGIGRSGAVCGVRLGALRVADIRAWKPVCEQASPPPTPQMVE